MDTGRVSYSDLYTQVNALINKRIGYNTLSPYGSQGNIPNGLKPFVLQSSGGDVSYTQLVTSLMQILDTALPPRIISGLQVTATNPISNQVNIMAGQGTVGGVVFELLEDLSLTVPFDNTTPLFYVNLYANIVKIESVPNSLTLAKIIVPFPATWAEVQDKRDNTTQNAYIQSFIEYKLYGFNNQLEEDSIELLRDNIGQVLADNLIGNLRLSENLKITNTAGSLAMDSNSITMSNPGGGILSVFNTQGVYFYDGNGMEIGKFATDGAHIGNIGIGTNCIYSRNYVSGISGFQITDQGYAEFENVTVRGRITSSVFTCDKVSAIGGQFIVANASSLSAPVQSIDTQIQTCENVFSTNDILLFKNGGTVEYMCVNTVCSCVNPTYGVTRDITSSYATKPSWGTGSVVVSTGNAITQNGYIFMDAVSQYSPYIDILKRNSSSATDVCLCARYGRLDGVVDSNFGTLTGYGLYATNVFLKGCLYASTIKTACTGSRIEMDTNSLRGYDSNGNIIFCLMETTTPGDLLIGQDPRGTGCPGMYWDATACTLCVGGCISVSSISASAITGGTLSLCKGITIQSCEESSGSLGCSIWDASGISSYLFLLLFFFKFRCFAIS